MSRVSFVFSTTLWPAWKLGSERGQAREREKERGADREKASSSSGAAWGWCWEGFRVQGSGPAYHLHGKTLGCVEGVRTLSGGHSGPHGPSARRLLRASFSKVSALVHFIL